MSFDPLLHDLQKLTHDEDEKIATLAQALMRLIEEKEVS